MAGTEGYRRKPRPKKKLTESDPEFWERRVKTIDRMMTVVVVMAGISLAYMYAVLLHLLHILDFKWLGFLFE